MKYRNLGSSGLKVSEVAYGGWLTTGRTVSDQTTDDIVHKAFDLGITFFDTADVYHRGEAELSLAKSIKSLKRSDIVIGTKCFFPMSDNPNDCGLSKKHIFESLHGSLQRLDLDYVDLLQFHRYDPETPIEESVRAVGELIAQGKMLYWGVSEWPAEQIARAHHIAKELNVAPPVSNQPCYNIVHRYIEKAVLPISIELGVGQVCFSPLAQGILTGKYKPGASAPAGSRGADDTSNTFMTGHMEDEDLLSKVEKLSGLAADLGCSTPQLALAWILSHDGISSVIVGATKLSQIEDNAAASDLEFEDDVWKKIDTIFGVQ
jgi:voltage-dependent potassium channel beta subunit